MTLSPDVRSRIEHLLAQHPVVLFMKGTRASPRCGFSAAAVGALDSVLDGYHDVDVLADPEIREGIKAYGDWPTIPQLYVRGELVGGSDIIQSMMNSGELHRMFGAPEPDRTPPAITLSEPAAAAIREALEDADDAVLHLSIDGRYQARFELRPAEGNEIVAHAGGIALHFDPASARRADGLEIGWAESVQGAGFVLNNPNAPAGVAPLSVQDLAARLHAGTIRVLDVRPLADRMRVPFPAGTVLDQDTASRIAQLPKDTPLAFLCHHGNSSRNAAEHFRGLGFTKVYNVEGGIDAWSRQVDPSVPRY